MVDLQKHRRRIVNPGTWAAFENLIESASANGLDTVDVTGFLTGVKFYKDGEYVFAFQSNPHHLNFYIRKPARKRWGSLSGRARRHFDVARERNGETQIHIKSEADASRLADWLFRLP